MEPENYSSWARVTDPKAATLLARTEDRRFLEPFLGRERSAKQAAEELGIRLDAMAYRIRQLQEAGLLEETRREARKGRAIRYYRAVAGGFQVPFQALPYEDIQTLFLAMDLPARTQAFGGLARSAEGLEDWLLQMHRDEKDRVQIRIVPPEQDWRPDFLTAPEYPAVAFSWVPLRLNAQDAKTLQREVFELIGRYFDRAEAGANQTHWLGLLLAPLPKP